MRQDGDHKVEDVHFECRGLQVRLDLMASQLLAVHKSLTLA